MHVRQILTAGQGGEFAEIARLFRPLTFGAPEALELMDDAAVISSRTGYDLVITTDAIVEGVHFLSSDPPDAVARKLAAVNLSDLAAKTAEPYGAFLAVAWPRAWGESSRQAFAEGLRASFETYSVKLFGGDTVSTPGPFTATLTLLGWLPQGTMLKRSGARPGDVLLVSGVIGDGGLGLDAARGGLMELGADLQAALAARYRSPKPRLELRDALRGHASAAADVSDGLLADAGHIGEASGFGVAIQLESVPLSFAATAWLGRQDDVIAARLRLATAGDDYEIVCAASPEASPRLIAAAAQAGVAMTAVGVVADEMGLQVSFLGRPVSVDQTGWRHL